MGFEKIEADLYVDPNASLLIDSDPGAMFITDGIAADYRSMRVVMDEEPDFGADIRLESGHFTSLGGFSLARGELCSPILTEAYFSPRAAVHHSTIDIEKGKVTYDSFGSAESNQFWLYEAGESSWESARLVSWLDSELRTEDILQHELQAFLFRVIRHLTDARKLSLAELAAFKYRLLGVLRTRLSDARKTASKKIGFDLFSEDDSPNRKLRWSWEFSFDLARPLYTKPQDLVAGGYRFAKHFFPVIQDIKDRDEELECAKIIDGRVPEIAIWVRNIPRRP